MTDTNEQVAEEVTMGRPTVFKAEYIEQVKKLCALAATDTEIADFFDVSVRTVHRWKLDHPDFCHALKIAKEDADNRVERSLYQRATGYEQSAVKIFQYEGKGVEVPYREIVAPDTTAAIFWLKNRKKDEWRDRSESTTTHDVTTELGDLMKELNSPVFPKDE